VLLGQSITRMRRDPNMVFDYDRAMAASFCDTFIPLKRAIDAAAGSPQAIPPEPRTRFIGHLGSYLVRIYPRDDVAAEAARERIVNALRTIDPEVTGSSDPSFGSAFAATIGSARKGVVPVLKRSLSPWLGAHRAELIKIVHKLFAARPASLIRHAPLLCRVYGRAGCQAVQATISFVCSISLEFHGPADGGSTKECF